MELFKNFYIFPHEYLSLLLNARSRLSEMKSCYVPQKEIQKTEYTNYNKDNRYMMYKLKVEDLRKDYRPTNLLKEQLENDFFINPPTQDEGNALCNKEAGVTIDKVDRELILSK